MELVDIPSNPVPEGAVAGRALAPDGTRIRYARWPVAVHPGRGTVLLLQGRGEFIEKYFETIVDLRRRGFAVVTFDWRGQGGSDRLLRDGRKGHVRAFEDYVGDLMTVMRTVVLADCPPPYHVLAHSTGGAVALLAAERLRTQIERMVLSAPLVGLHGSGRVAQSAALVLDRIGFRRSYLPGGGATLVTSQPFEQNVVTSDRDRYCRATEIIEHEPALGTGSPTIGWAAAAIRACRLFETRHFAMRVPMPVLFVLAGADAVVSNVAAERLAARVKTIVTVRVPGARHELLMERDPFRDQFLAAFDAFVLDARGGGAARG
ncbi:alpha/beta hydrolase [Rhizobiales bacterium L72]|uniref:Alpha/beta hydrolase n=1 Tax=Propylenella binzhouense TaxID=2555902 RepID=A0A964WT59_9HYPH|nr:alpha/beta hydrolase [Propylenella binzhouense]